MFYAFRHKYGIGMRSAEDGSKIGTVLFYRRKSERDSFVKYDINAEIISSREARKYLIDELLSYVQPETVGEIRAASMQEIVKMVRDMRAIWSEVEV